MASITTQISYAVRSFQVSEPSSRTNNSSPTFPCCGPQLNSKSSQVLTSAIFGKVINHANPDQTFATLKPYSFQVKAAKRVSTGRNLVLNSTLIVEKGNEEEVSKLCKDILQWGNERKLDKKLGVLQFECNVDAFDTNVFHFWERYDSFGSMNDTRASPEHCKFIDEVRPFLSEPVALAAYEYNNGQIGCMLNPIGPKGEGGLDDATGQGGSGGGASYKQTSQSVMQGISDREGWGLDRALEISQTKGVAAAAKDAQEAAAIAIANSLKNLFKKKE